MYKKTLFFIVCLIAIALPILNSALFFFFVFPKIRRVFPIFKPLNLFLTLFIIIIIFFILKKIFSFSKILFFSGLIIFSYVIYPVVINHRFNNFDDSLLNIHLEKVDNKKNGYYYLLKTKLWKPKDLDILRNCIKDKNIHNKVVENFLEKNKGLEEKISSAINYQSFQILYPFPANLDEESLVWDYRNLYYLFFLQIQYFENNKYDEYKDNLKIIHKLISNFHNKKFDIYDVMLGVNSKKRLCKEFNNILKQKKYDFIERDKMKMILGSFPLSLDAIKEGLKYEYAFSKNVVINVFNSLNFRNALPKYLTLKKIIKIFNYLCIYLPKHTVQLQYNCIMNSLRVLEYPINHEEITEEYLISKFAKDFFTPWYDSIGQFLILNVAFDVSHLAARCAEADGLQILVILQIALCEYEEKYLRLPDTLEELVPTYIKEVPMDLMSGKNVKYSKNHRVIYMSKQNVKKDVGVDQIKEETKIYLEI